jgi:dipeptidyl aminopeptidase/acylaminoacyl peptidase
MTSWICGFGVICSTVFAMEGTMQAPYGSWESPITAEMIASGGVKLGSIQEENGTVYYSEMRPKEKGRNAVVRVVGNQQDDFIQQEYNVRTTVHEYGGGSSLFNDNAFYFSNFTDQQLYVRNKAGVTSKLTNEKNTRFADGCFDSSRNLLFYVLEIQGTKVENAIGTVDPKTGVVKKIAQGCDFYSTPRLSPDHKYLSYYCWNDPYMPWDGGELRVSKIKADGSLEAYRVVAGSVNESICQSSWGPDGKLYFVSDRSGWWNLYTEQNGKVLPLCPMSAEFGQPQWVFGSTTFDFFGKDKIVAVYTLNGTDYAGFVPMKGGSFAPIDLPYTIIRNPSVTGNKLYFVGGSAEKPAEAVQYDLVTKTIRVVKKSRELTVDSGYFSIPKAIDFPTTDGKIAHALYYAPKNPKFSGKVGELPPLLVLSHGGPTSQSTQLFNLELQYLTSRGFAVIDVNYGGSTGYGREYRNRLLDQWGVVDVDDCTNAALYCVKNKLADPKRLAIAGGSAGGYTTLACLTFRDTFSAGASYYGVSDLEALVKHTHKFEARYLDRLVGPYPEKKALYDARSPIYHVDQIKCPIILLQGDEDAIVPPAQSTLMYESLLKRGIPTAYLLFKGEQHGFRQSANIKRSIEAEAYFFSKIFGFTLADKVEPVDIKNFK